MYWPFRAGKKCHCLVSFCRQARDQAARGFQAGRVGFWNRSLRTFAKQGVHPRPVNLAIGFALCYVIAMAATSSSFGAEVDAAANKSAVALVLVRQSLEAEAAGDKVRRDDYLHRALVADPDCVAAHWHNGEVRSKDGWVSIEVAGKAAWRAGNIAQYRQMHEIRRPTSELQRRLGDWCANAGLQPQARLHWTMALALDPESEDLRSKLGFVVHGNTLIAADDLERIEQVERDRAAADRTWAEQLESIRVRLAVSDSGPRLAARQELRAIRDPDAIPMMEFYEVTEPDDFGQAVVAALSAMPEQVAVDSLVRHAVYSQHPVVRELASLALRKRSLYAYVPILIDVLQAPIHAEFEEYQERGDPRHRLTLTQDGPLAVQAVVSSGGSARYLDIQRHPKRRTVDVSQSSRPDVTLEQDRLLAQQAVALNKVAETRNRYATLALRTATGQRLGDTPAEWWKWWLDHNEIYQYPEKPVVVTSRDYTPARSSVRVTYSSCFMAGTKVWTMDGPQPIERIKPGEFVLSQSPASGEVTYKPVVATTVRPKSPVIEIQTDQETIRATRGHPFWVSGVGWRMTKELKPGDRLHTVTGPVEIIGAEIGREAVCYNLVVDDFSTYFVGSQKILVHDNTVRDVTPVLVPGLVAK